MLDQEIANHNPDAKIFPHALRNGLIWGLFGIAIQLGMYFTGILEQTMSGSAPMSVTILSTLVSVAIAVWCIYNAIAGYRADKGSLTFGNAVGTGALTGLVYGVISAVWALIFFNFIFPDFYDTLQETVLAQYEEQGLDEEQIEQAMGIVGMFSNPIFSAISTIPSGALWGTILSLIIGIFTKTD